MNADLNVTLWFKALIDMNPVIYEQDCVGDWICLRSNYLNDNRQCLYRIEYIICLVLWQKPHISPQNEVISNTRLMLWRKITLSSFVGQRFSFKCLGRACSWLVTALAEIEQLLLLRLYRLYLIFSKSNCLIFWAQTVIKNTFIFSMTRATELMQTGQTLPAGHLLSTPGIVYWR